MMTFWPHTAWRRSASVRASRSLDAPGACGTSSVTGRLGKSCAMAGAPDARPRTANAMNHGTFTSALPPSRQRVGHRLAAGHGVGGATKVAGAGLRLGQHPLDGLDDRRRGVRLAEMLEHHRARP